MASRPRLTLHHKAGNMSRRDFTSGECKHTSGTLASYTHCTCKDCGAVVTDTGWGSASHTWFKDLNDAKFYQRNGRIPDQPKQST